MAKFSLPIPDKLQKSMFWIVIGVLSLVMMIVWWLATSSLAKQTTDNISAINVYIATGGGITPTANQESVDALKAEADRRRKNMFDAWVNAYKLRQEQLVWPQNVLDANGSVITPGLPKEFVDAAEKLPQAPEWLQASEEGLLRPEHKEMFRNTARRQIQTLCAIVGSANRVEGKAAAAPTTGAANQAEDVVAPGEICIWTTASQQNAAQLLQFADGTNPATQDIMYAQQSMWIYHTLFKIIKATNESLKESQPPKDLAHFNAPVKMIHEISIAEKFSAKEATAKPVSLEGDDAEAEPVKIPNELVRAGERYVNERGQRLKPEELLPFAKPKPDSELKPAQYRLMPVFMRLEVDQRYLGRLLAECANSPLTVEVKDVTFKVLGHADREAAKATPEGGVAQSGPKETKNFYDVTVEITGHIYLYFDPMASNKPAEAPAADEAPAPDDAAPADATTPATGG